MIASLVATLAFACPQEPTLVERTLESGVRIREELLTRPDGSTVRHGTYDACLPDGTPIASGGFKEGEPSGRWQFHHADGQVASRGGRHLGRPTGDWTYYHPSGAKWAAGRFSAGHPTGAWMFWAPDGETPDADHSGWYEWHEGTTRGLAHRGLLIDGRAHGPWTISRGNGETLLTAEFLRDSPIGAWRFYHSKGAFDPDFVSQDHGDSGAPAGFPVLPDLPGEGPSSHDGEHPLPDLSDLAELPPCPWATVVEHDRLRASLQALMQSEDPRVRATESYRLQDPKAVPLILNALQTLDWSAPGDVELGQLLVEKILQPIFRGRSYGWSWSIDATAQETNALAFLRAYEFYVLTGSTRGIWHLDLTERIPRGRSPEAPGVHTHPHLPGSHFLGQPDPRAISARVRASRVRGNGGRKSDQALSDALDWLVKHQNLDGSWDSDEFMRHCQEGSQKCDGAGDPKNDVGVTSLALMALIGNGSSIEHGPHQDAVLGGIRWLVTQQEEVSGGISHKVPRADGTGGVSWWVSGTFLIDHAIATRVLCLALQSSANSRLSHAAHSAVAFLMDARNPYGAWRYDVPPQGDNDTVVTGFAVLALREAQRAGIAVDESAFVGALNWLNEVSDPATGRVGYDSMGGVSNRHLGINDDFPPEKGEANTAVGLLCRLQLGQDPEEHIIIGKHAALMLRTLPEWDPEGFGCDTFYWAFGTYSMFEMGGRNWEAWNKAMLPALLASQCQEGHARGSWDNVGPWGYSGGRIYSTAMMALCLEVYLQEPPKKRR